MPNPQKRVWYLIDLTVTADPPPMTLIGSYENQAGDPGAIFYFVDDPHAAEGIRNHLRNGNLPPEPQHQPATIREHERVSL